LGLRAAGWEHPPKTAAVNGRPAGVGPGIGTPRGDLWEPTGTPFAGHDEATRSTTTATPATNLSAPERILLSCVASDTEWQGAGILVVIDRDYPDQIDVEVVHKALMISDAGGVHVAQLAASSASARALVSWTPRCSSIDGIGMRLTRLL
jgi:hypothetical protein